MVRTLGIAGALALVLATTAIATREAQTFTAAPNCGPEITNLEAVANAPMILLGELHGLEMVPTFAIDLACRLAVNGTPVMLALEIPRQEQGRIDAFLATRDGTPNEALLLDGPFWQREFQDGRSSRARLILLDVARALEAQRLPLRVVAIDDAEVPGPARDSVMASSLLSARKPGETAVFLVGDLHARTRPGAPWNRTMVWAGVRLRAQEPKLVSLANRYIDGEAWVCFGNAPSECGVKRVKGSGVASGFRIERFAATDSVGFDGTFDVGRATASPPARDGARARH